MKFSYSNYPILKLLKEGKAEGFMLNDKDHLYWNLQKQLYQEVVGIWNENSHFFKNEIFFVSKSFYESCLTAAPALMELFTRTLVNDLDKIEIRGTFIIKETIFMVNLFKEKDAQELDVNIFAFRKSGGLHSVYTSKYSWYSSISGVDNTNKAHAYANHLSLALIVCISLFSRYADVETKIFSPKSKSNNIKCFYNNQTDFKITQLDSKWFTNLVSSEGFKVRGHFRLQPYKDGSKKIIWIEEFKKNGYKSKAKILKDV